MFEPSAIDLLENVFVDDAETVMSLVSATVPLASGNVIVLSAVGLVTCSVVSLSSAEEPSNVMLDSNVPTAGAAAHSIPFVAEEFAVRIYPFVPAARRVTVSAAEATSKSPFASTHASVHISWPFTVAVDPSTTSPAFTLKSFVTVAIFYLLG